MKGFTLVEVLLAIVVFSMIATLSWTALGPAGEGFMILKDSRTKLEQQQWLGKQLRKDVSYLTRAEDKTLPLFQIKNDSRGATGVDELEMLVRDPMYPGLTMVRYFVDEDRGVLVRETKSPLSRHDVEPESWDLAKVASFNVEAMTYQSEWKEVWEAKPPFVLPRSLRVQVRDEDGEMQWQLPLFIR